MSSGFCDDWRSIFSSVAMGSMPFSFACLDGNKPSIYKLLRSFIFPLDLLDYRINIFGRGSGIKFLGELKKSRLGFTDEAVDYRDQYQPIVKLFDWKAKKSV